MNRIDKELLAILACPLEHHAPLEDDGDHLSCTECGRRFPIQNGIPVLLVDDASPPAMRSSGARALQRGLEAQREIDRADKIG